MALVFLQGPAATANGNGLSYDLENDPRGTLANLEIRETAGGTATVTLQGSYDGTNWYSVGYQRVDAQATLTRAVAAVSVTANLAAVYQILDFYPQVRAVVSAVATGATLSIKLFTQA